MEYQHRYTRNPFRIARSIWRVTKNLESTADALVLEEVFNNSRFTRKYAAWEEVAEELIPHCRDIEALVELPRLTNLDPEKMLAQYEPGSLGHTLASNMIQRNLNPNLFKPAEIRSPRDYVINHLAETHDVWHIATGYSTNVAGEFALTGFYSAQIAAPAFSMLIGVGMLNTAFTARHAMNKRLSALHHGWQAGKRASSLFGIDWRSQFDTPLIEIRNQYSLPDASPFHSKTCSPATEQ